MMVHMIFASAVMISALSIKRNGKKTRLYFVGFLIVFLFAALRYGYGNDYFVYLAAHTKIQSGGGSYFKNELLFTCLNKLIPNFYLLVALTSFVFVFTVYRLMKNNLSADMMAPALFVFLFSPYIFLVNLSSIRQCLAMNIFIFAVEYARKHKFWSYVILIFVAALVHRSAALMLPIYFIADERLIRPHHKWLILGATSLLLFCDGVFDTIMRFMLELMNNKNYSYYYSDGIGNSVPSVIAAAVILVYLLINSGKVRGGANVYLKLCIIGYMLSVLAFRSNTIIRLRMYFEIFSVVAIPTLIKINLENGLVLRAKSKGALFCKAFNRFVMPIFIFAVYIVKYINFFRDPTWSMFFDYHTVLEVFL